MRSLLNEYAPDSIWPVVILGALAGLWIGVWFQWRGKKFAAYLKKHPNPYIARFTSAEWVKHRSHLIFAPLAFSITIGFMPTISVMHLDKNMGVDIAIGFVLLAAVVGVAGPVGMIVLMASVVRNSRPRFLVPPHERDQPTGLDLKQRYVSAVNRRRR